MSDGDREAFERALRLDRCDVTTRLVYADWLEEGGLDDEATEQRRRATPAWVEAARWMEDFARQAGQTCENWGETWNWQLRKTVAEERWRDITFDDLIQAGHDYVEREGYWTQMGSESLRDLMYDPPTAELYWRHWRTITGVLVSDARLDGEYGRGTAPFSCSC